MSTINVLNMAGETVGTVELSDGIFGIEPNTAVVHEVVKNHLANLLAGHIINIRLKHDLRSPFLSLLQKPSAGCGRKPSAGSC